MLHGLLQLMATVVQLVDGWEILRLTALMAASTLLIHAAPGSMADLNANFHLAVAQHLQKYAQATQKSMPFSGNPILAAKLA